MLIKIEDGKSNFIDHNDNFVGYEDQDVSCCENPYWEFEDSFGNPLGENVDPQLPLEFTGEVEESNSDFSISFKCTNGYTLKLYNIHNGYYSHFWESTINGTHNRGYI